MEKLPDFDLQELENVRLNYLGKKGSISNEMKNLASLSIEEKKTSSRGSRNPTRS